jgi:hypothetical protein
MYDGLGAFGKERNKVKYMCSTTTFSTRGNVYYGSSLWYKKEVGLKHTKNPTKLLDEEREAMEREDKEGKERAPVQNWVRKPKDNYKNHPSYQNLLRKYGQMPGAYWNIDGWKGYEDARASYNTFIWNGNKLPEIQVDEWLQNSMAIESVAVEVGNADDNNAGDLQSTGDSIGRLPDLDYTTEDGGFCEANA